ncbi:hypothetical protein NEF87_002679 [Candidatus Lokiarchaeum ossiferum]|uniref:HFX-2341-like N-terminal domain-containing protein n=1 Tax=Candidatus Lokiarchaeum ossiferum TaxID=2951803 RepID=A0ABY6HVA9_9ARCH|nr:hypothetical protein NEF87_002679 [Candidatus Lokiarchaeum sp. B-35]
MNSLDLVEERNILVVPIGLENERVVKSCQIYPVNVIYLLKSNFESNSDHKEKNSSQWGIEQYSKTIASEVIKKFENTFFEIQPKNCHLGSLPSTISILNDIYEIEQKKGKLNKIYINISTASKLFAIGAYIFASQFPDICKLFYLATNNYLLLEHLKSEKGDLEKLKTEFRKFGLTKGPFKVVNIPILKSDPFSTDEKRLINYLAQFDHINSIKEILENLKKDTNAKERMNLRRSLEKLEKNNLLILKKSGKSVQVLISDELKQLAGSFILE